MAGENAYSDWLNGAPIIRPTADGTFSDWLDGTPLVQYEAATTDLVVAAADQLHDADNVALIVPLTVAAADHLHDGDGIVLTQDHSLDVAAADHLHAAEGDLLLQSGLTLVVADCHLLHVADAPALTQHHSLAVAAADHLHAADSIVLTALYLLTVAECYHIHAPPNVALTQAHQLAVDESTHLHSAANITLTVPDLLIVDDCAHLVYSDYFGLDAYHYVKAGQPGTSYWSVSSFSSRPVAHTLTVPSGSDPHVVGAAIYCHSDHTNQIRMGVFKGRTTWEYNSQTYYTPDSTATLLVDIGQTSGSATGQFLEVSCTPTSVAEGDALWLAFKFNSGFNFRATKTFGDWEDDEYIGELGGGGIDLDVTTGWPSTWPADTGAYHSPFVNNSYIKIRFQANATLIVKPALHDHMADEIPNFNPVVHPADAVHLHSADSADITDFYLIAADTSHVLYSEHGLATPLAVEGADQLHSADNIDLVEVLDLVVAEAAHDHVAEAIALTGTHTLAPADSDHLHDADGLALTQAHTLQVAAADHASWSSVVAVTQRHALAVGAAFHFHGADILAIGVHLTVAEAAHDMVSDQMLLGVHLPVDEAAHDIIDDAVALIPTPIVSSAEHLHFSPLLDLTGTHYLDVTDSDHVMTSDTFWICQIGSIVVQGAYHDQVAQNPTLLQANRLAAADAYHLHDAEALALTQEHHLDMDAGYGHSHHVHSADNIVFAALPEIEQAPVLASLTVQRSYRSKSTAYTVAPGAAVIFLTEYQSKSTSYSLKSLSQEGDLLSA